MKIFHGNANKALAIKIAEYAGISVGNSTSKYFSNREIFVEINDEVRGDDIFIVQSICHPANDNLMELLILVDALKRSAVKSITAIIPYLGYSRQDRRGLKIVFRPFLLCLGDHDVAAITRLSDSFIVVCRYEDYG